MDETANEIAARIDRTRERLGSNLRELEDKVDAATDWREHYRDRPHVFLGAAFVGGVVLAGVLRPRSAGRALAAMASSSAVRGSSPVRAQARDFWNNVQGALVGLASARIKEYIDEFIPGFEEHYQRATQRTAIIDPR